MESERSDTSTNSLPKCLQVLGLGQDKCRNQKAETATSLSGLPGPNSLSHHLLLPMVCTARKLEQQHSWNRNPSTDIWHTGIPRGISIAMLSISHLQNGFKIHVNMLDLDFITYNTQTIIMIMIVSF